MMVKKIILNLSVVVLASLLSAGCVPTSLNPLSPIQEAKVDTRLVGTWIPVSANEKGYLHFLPGKGGVMDGIAVSFNKKNSGSWDHYSLFSSQINNHSFLNVREVEKTGKLPDDGKTPYYLVRYQISQSGRLQLWVLSEKAVKVAMGKGMKGEIIKGTFVSNIRITASTEELVKYIKQVGPEALFSEPLVTLQRQ